MKTIEELVGLSFGPKLSGNIPHNTQNDDTSDNLEESPYLAEVSYSILHDGSLDIRFAWLNDLNIANVMGELLYQVHSGLFKQQTLQELGKMGDDIKHGKFIESILTTWANLHNRINNAPLIRPSEVSRANMMYQQPPQE